MATVNYYYRTANTASTLPYGAVSAGGGAGTEASPYNSFSGVEALVEDVATDHSADDLVLHFHPACFFQAGTGNFDAWTNVGKSANSWKSVTLKRWESIVDSQPLYADWKPTIDSTQEVLDSSWTEGYISGGVWYAGSGDVFRATIPALGGNSPQQLRWVGGHVTGDNPGNWTIAGTFCSALSYVTEEGDYALVTAGTYLYVKTGATGVKPGARWGSFHYVILGASALQLVTCERITFENFQWSGNYIYGYTAADGESCNNITFTNCSGRMANSSGWIRFATDGNRPTAEVHDIVINNPDASAIEGTRVDKGTQANERGSENGISFDVSRCYNITIKNPKITGFSHAGIQVFGNEAVLDYGDPADYNEWPKDILIYVDDTSDGKGVITGGVNYQRGINLRIAHRGVVRGLRIAKQTVQTQLGGNILWQSNYFDNTCPAYSDTDVGLSKANLGNHIAYFRTQYGHSWTGTKLRIVGSRFDVDGAYYAVWWGDSLPDDLIEIEHNLIRDAGHVRFAPQESAANAGRTRRRCPILPECDSTADSPAQMPMRNNLLIFNASTEAMSSRHVAGQSVVTANDTSWPLIAYDATSTWGGGYISGNQQVTGTTGFDFDSSLNYTGARKTPIQTSARRARGYM